MVGADVFLQFTFSSAKFYFQHAGSLLSAPRPHYTVPWLHYTAPRLHYTEPRGPHYNTPWLHYTIVLGLEELSEHQGEQQFTL